MLFHIASSLQLLMIEFYAYHLSRTVKSMLEIKSASFWFTSLLCDHEILSLTNLFVFVKTWQVEDMSFNNIKE